MVNHSSPLAAKYKDLTPYRSGLFGRKLLHLVLLLALAGMISACVRPMSQAGNWNTPSAPTGKTTPLPGGPPTQKPLLRPTRAPGTPVVSPTADPPHTLPTPRQNDEEYTVLVGDTLGKIAQHYGADINVIIQANNIANPDLLEVGQVLTIPAANPLPPGPDFKIIPDSELVNGPAAAEFDLKKFVTTKKGYLLSYREEVEGKTLTGADIIAEVSRNYSVNPRLLLAVLDHISGWVTQPAPNPAKNDFPIGYLNPAYKGLYRQVSWAANNINCGYYLWKAGGISAWILADGALVPPAPTINAGTAAVQHFYSLLFNQTDWNRAVEEDGLFSVYQSMFGYPFDYAVEPLIPDNLSQPEMQLPFESGSTWSFTGGPHGGWGSGSGWAAIDFAPPGDTLGCVQNDAWVVAITDGQILRADNGAVIQELDADGIEQTGWTILYMHTETRDRVKVGTKVKAGDRIGHPSCEGGVSNGTHTHIARRYNGEWVSADGSLPFNLDGWISNGDGTEYDGWLIRGNQTVEAWDGRKDENQISR